MINMKRLFFALILGMLGTALSLNAFAGEEPTVSPWASLKDLQSGNQRFCDGKLTHQRQDPSRRADLAQSQHPKAIVISCSDSRVPSEIVFDQGLGDVFSIRLAGHVLNAEAVASVEYAIEHLGARLIVVMGHESCGAVKAAVATPEGKTAGSEDLDKLLGQIRHNIVGHYPKEGDKTFLEPVQANVSGVAKDLVSRSKIVKAAVANEKVIVVQAVYSLASGKAKFMDVSQASLKQLALGGAPKEEKHEEVAKEDSKREPASESHEEHAHH